MPNINTLPVGAVTCSGKKLGTSLFTNGVYNQVVWYGLTDTTNTLFSAQTINWHVAGNPQANIAPFSFTDTALTISFNLADTLHLSQAFIPCSVSGQFDTLVINLTEYADQYINGEQSFIFKYGDSINITPAMVQAENNLVSPTSVNKIMIQATAAHLTKTQQSSGTYYCASEWTNQVSRALAQ